MAQGDHKPNQIYRFGEYSVDPRAGRLEVNGTEVHLPKRPFDILVRLIENRDGVITRSELLDEFWEGRDVYDDSLRKSIATIRKAIGDAAKPASCIETRYGGGYRFIAPVTAEWEPEAHIKEQAVRPESRSLAPRLAFAAAVVTLILLVTFIYVAAPFKPASVTADARPETGAPISSIAILPLTNLTGNSSDEYFSDGLTESLITELARSSNLRVISHSSTFALKGKSVDTQELGQRLGVDAIVEGGVQKRGVRLNVRVRLVDVRDGSIRWTSSDFERDMSQASDLQDFIACSIAAELRTEICGETSSGTRNGLAYQEYLKGRYEWNKRTAAGIKQSIVHYSRAIAADPNYSLAYTGLAESYLQGIWHVPFDSAEAITKARTAALRAVELDDNSAEAHTALAGVYSLEWKWTESERELGRAVEKNPRYARAYHVLAFAQMLAGRFPESLAAIDRAAELDPLNMVVSTDKAVLLLTAGRRDEAFRQWEKTIAADPGFLMAREHRLAAYEFLGDDDAALSDYVEAERLRGTSPRRIDAMRRLASGQGFTAVRRAELVDLLKQMRKGSDISPVTIANYYARLGDSDRAFEWLEKALASRDARIVLLGSTYFSRIHDDPRYPLLAARVGLAPITP
jgi:TolB-like protein/DNA-binding winged helix-turn-helix (wHTH) protein/tetratricopeptide (TPR) repeat protein